MDSGIDDSVFVVDDESDVFVPPAPKPKAVSKFPSKPALKVASKTAPKAASRSAPKPASGKAPTTKAIAKKTLQTTLSTKPATKKRAQHDSDEDESDPDQDPTRFSNTPPSAKKQKIAPAPKKVGGVPFAEITNNSIMMDVEKVSPTATSKQKKSASEMYQKLSQIEHIIKRPDTYIGSIEQTAQIMWIYNKETTKMEHRIVNFVPGLYKIFDEILVNAVDNKQRDPNMTYLKVNIDRSTGVISVENNGKAIPVVMHEKENVYIPELLFGHLLAGSNFDDNEQKTVGGRNGYGAKLCNVFSTEFHLEIQDSENGKRYKQSWTNNMGKMEKAKITANKTSDFVRVSFKPDYARFGMPNGIDGDLESVLLRRVYDMAGTVRGIKVYLNGEQIKLKNFEAYCEMYAKGIAKDREDDDASNCKVYVDKDKSHPRWEIGFAVSDGSFQQVSFANSIATTSGGTHVNYIADQICQHLLKAVTKKLKGHNLKPMHIRNHIFIFINCFVNNPAFTSQTKENMTTKVSAFGSNCVLSDDFLKKIASSDVLARIMNFAEKKVDQMMAKSDGSKRSRINNAKLTEANWAGTGRGHLCTLILTEGDSAKGLAIAGRAVLDPDKIGVFPLRGKLLNVRDAPIDQITKNAEIQNIKQILGLRHKQNYADTMGLRYGHLMIMADQDHDGSHIKGLLINFLQVQFPSLLKIDQFLQQFITPIVKVWKGPDPKNPTGLHYFFTMPEYETWTKQERHGGKWDHKYLKGLGSSSTEDAQIYFNSLDDHLKEFETMKPAEADLFELAFSKKKADARKEWLGNFVPGTFLDQAAPRVTYDDFINKELILFSMADNIRSIPSMLDGFKPGQRKVMAACFLRNLVKDMKVFELSGYVSQVMAYHHGDASLSQTIVALAQDFIGSNNVNCLEPSGSFGTRLQGGGDAASPRYIFTRLSPFARKIFPTYDEPILEWQYDDEKQIEPMAYAPVLPMVLVNGADGIGTGWSTNIPNYHPIDIVRNLKRRMGRLDGDSGEKPFETMTPWYRGWKGEVEQSGPDKFKFNGKAFANAHNPNEITISELPIRVWTDDFKARLEDVMSGAKGPSWIKDYREFNDHANVHFEVVLDDKYAKAVHDEGVVDRFKLTKLVSTTNLVAFDTRGQIRKYSKVEEILEEFYLYRLNMYSKRKAHWLKVLHADYRKLQNQARFVQEIVDGILVVSKKKKAVLVAELRQKKYEAFPKIQAKGSKQEDDAAAEGEDDGDAETDSSALDYDYLLSMPIWALTVERLDRLNSQIARKKAEHDELMGLSERDLWCKDLDDFAAEWEKQLEMGAKAQKTMRSRGRRVSLKIGAGKPTGRGRAGKKDEEYQPEKGGVKKTIAKRVPKVVENKSHQRFADMFGAKPKPAPEKSAPVPAPDPEGLSDDDFAALGKEKQTTTTVKSEADDTGDGAVVRTKRAAVSRVKSWAEFDDLSEGDGDKLLGDVGAMVKGIEKSSHDPSSGRLSLFSTATQNGGAVTHPKLKSKASRTFEFDDLNDNSNYELLAKSTPHKTVIKSTELVSLPDAALPKSQPAFKNVAVAAASSVPTTKKQTTIAAPGRAGGLPKTAAKDIPTTKAKLPAKLTLKPTGESPAAKAYAAKKRSRAAIISDDDDDDEDDEDDDMKSDHGEDASSPAVVVTARPARAARTQAKPKPTYLVESEDSLASIGQDDDDDDVDENGDEESEEYDSEDDGD